MRRIIVSSRDDPIPGIRYSWWTWKFGLSFTNWVLRFFGRVECDRCGSWVKGWMPRLGSEDRMSAGVYVCWRDYMTSDEWVICDQCMWADPRYQAIYGVHK